MTPSVKARAALIMANPSEVTVSCSTLSKRKPVVAPMLGSVCNRFHPKAALRSLTLGEFRVPGRDGEGAIQIGPLPAISSIAAGGLVIFLRAKSALVQSLQIKERARAR